jgi:integrase/recombinase XerD
MLYCGLRSAEVLGLDVTDADIGGLWVQVTGKGNRERRVPLDPDVGAVIQAYLLAERPETASTRMFIVAKGPHRGQPLTEAGLRRIFRYHRGIAGVPAGNPHALRHTFGTALAEAGVDLAVMQALLGHAHVDTSARYSLGLGRRARPAAHLPRRHPEAAPGPAALPARGRRPAALRRAARVTV